MTGNNRFCIKIICCIFSRSVELGHSTALLWLHSSCPRLAGVWHLKAQAGVVLVWAPMIIPGMQGNKLALT